MKSVVIHYRLEVVDIDEKIDRIIQQYWLDNKGIFPTGMPELPGVDLNKARQYYYPSQVSTMADRLVNLSAIAIMDSKSEEGEPIPYCIILNPVDT